MVSSGCSRVYNCFLVEFKGFEYGFSPLIKVILMVLTLDIKLHRVANRDVFRAYGIARHRMFGCLGLQPLPRLDLLDPSHRNPEEKNSKPP